MAAAGVHSKVIQRVMRHSTITLTMDRYTHAFKSDEADAVAKLPACQVPWASRLELMGRKTRTPTITGKNRGAHQVD